MKRNTKKKKIIITGVAGFVGFHLAKKLLDEGWSVIGIDLLTDYYDPRMKQKRLSILKTHASFVFHKIDIANYKKLEALIKKVKPDEIVHLAAQAGVRYSLIDPWVYMRTNELGTLNIFEIAKRTSCPRVIYASSSSVYGGNKKIPMSEADRTDEPLAIYGVTKKSNELLAHAYNHLHGTELIGLRFFSLYGTWGRPDLALFKFTKNILLGKSIEVYNRGNMKRSFTHISDITSAISTLLAQKPSGRNEIYNLGGAKSVKLSDFVALIEKETKKKAKQKLLPMHRADVADSVADWSKANHDFGFVPTVSVEKGLTEFVEWFKENEKFLSSLKDAK